MTHEQVVEVVQAGLNTLIGADIYPVDTTDDTTPAKVVLTYGDPDKLVDMGNVLNSNTQAADMVFKAMFDTIGKIVIESREYVASLPKLYYNTREFGGMTEIIRTGLTDLMEDEMWNPNGFINYTDDTASPETGKQYAARMAAMEHATYKPKVHAQIYNKATSIMAAITTLREQLFTAFTGWGQVESFISALRMSVENSLALKAEYYALATVSVMIGKAESLGHEIPLVTLYNREKGVNIATGQTAMFDEDFMRFALSKIAETKDNMARFTTAFNDGDEPTFTPRNENRLILLSKFANTAKFNVRANTYNEQLLGIGDYDRVTQWMGIADTTGTFNFDTISKLMFTERSATEIGMQDATGGKTIENVIGVMYDRLAAGIMLEKKKLTTAYTAVNDSWNTFYHALVQYYVNPTHNIAYFTLN